MSTARARASRAHAAEAVAGESGAGGLRLAYDLRGIQTPYFPERGIARYVHHHVEALADRPEVASLYGLLEPERPLPAVAARLARRAGGLLDWRRASEALLPGTPLVHHVGSPFELDWTLADMLPAALRRPDVLRVVTLYDVIPLVHPEVHPGWLARRWRYRAELVRSADLVLCISAFTAEDGARRLGLDERRVRVIGTGVPAVATALLAGDAPPVLPGLEPQVVLYAGGCEHPRKNLPALVRAFGRLPAALREGHQLVIAGRIEDAVREALTAEAAGAGVAARVLIAGYVSDETLRRLFLTCRLFVYPSRYEGFGLPIVEAMSHGAPVVASGTTSCAEVSADPRATFDPADEGAMAAAMERVLTDPALAAELRSKGRALAAQHTWAAVAERTVRAYDEALGARRGRRWGAGARPAPLGRVAFATLRFPAPGTPAGALVALAGAVSAHTPVLVATPAALRPRGPRASSRPLERLAPALATRADHLVCLVDSPEALAWATDLMAGRGGTALLWDLDLVLGEGAGPVGVGLAALADAADRLVVADRLDEWRVRLAMGPGVTPVHVLAPPLGLAPAGGAIGHQPPLEAQVMLGRAREAVRTSRRLRLLVAPRPDRYGPFGEAEVAHAQALVVGLARRGLTAGLVLLGDADPDRILDAQRRSTDQGAGGRLLWSPWPVQYGLLAWSTAADAVLGLAPEPVSLVRAVIDHALTFSRPALVLSEAGPLSPSVHRLAPSATPAELADAAARLVGPGVAVNDAGVLAARSPERVAAALSRILAGER